MNRVVIALSGNACNLRLFSKIDLKPLIVIIPCWYPGAIYLFIVKPGMGSGI